MLWSGTNDSQGGSTGRVYSDPLMQKAYDEGREHGATVSEGRLREAAQPSPELLQLLKDSCDRDWKDESPEVIIRIACNALYWRDYEIAKLREKSDNYQRGYDDASRIYEAKLACDATSPCMLRVADSGDLLALIYHNRVHDKNADVKQCPMEPCKTWNLAIAAALESA